VQLFQVAIADFAPGLVALPNQASVTGRREFFLCRLTGLWSAVFPVKIRALRPGGPIGRDHQQLSWDEGVVNLVAVP